MYVEDTQNCYYSTWKTCILLRRWRMSKPRREFPLVQRQLLFDRCLPQHAHDYAWRWWMTNRRCRRRRHRKRTHSLPHSRLIRCFLFVRLSLFAGEEGERDFFHI